MRCIRLFVSQPAMLRLRCRPPAAARKCLAWRFSCLQPRLGGPSAKKQQQLLVSAAPAMGLASSASAAEATSTSTGKDVGMSNFLGKVYLSTGVGISGGLGTAQLLASTGLADAHALSCLGLGTLTALASVWGVDKCKAIAKRDVVCRRTGAFVVASTNPPARLLSFAGVSVGMGTVIAPMVSQIAASVSPSILPVATVLALTTMGASSAFAMLRPADSMLHWRAPLMAGLGGLIGVGVTALVAQLAAGAMGSATVANLAASLHSVDTYAGIVLFTGMNAYDTHLAMTMYRAGQADHLGCATQLYLNFVNLLIRIMEALAKAKQQSKR